MRLNNLNNVNTIQFAMTQQKKNAAKAARLRDLIAQNTNAPAAAPAQPERAPQAAPGSLLGPGGNSRPGTTVIIPGGQAFIPGSTADVVKFFNENPTLKPAAKLPRTPDHRPGKSGAAWSFAETLNKLPRAERGLVQLGLADDNLAPAIKAAAAKGPKALQALIVSSSTNA